MVWSIRLIYNLTCIVHKLIDITSSNQCMSLTMAAFKVHTVRKRMPPRFDHYLILLAEFLSFWYSSTKKLIWMWWPVVGYRHRWYLGILCYYFYWQNENDDNTVVRRRASKTSAPLSCNNNYFNSISFSFFGIMSVIIAGHISLCNSDALSLLLL